MASQVQRRDTDDVAGMQSLLTELSEAHAAELRAQRKLIATLRQAEAEGERQTRLLTH